VQIKPSCCNKSLFFSFCYSPFGVAILFAGIDEKGPQLFHMDPSGTYVQYDAKAIGSGSEGAQQSLQEAYHKVTSCTNFCFVLYS
jgi:20S proteasome alpha/beta subunit